MKIEPTPFDNFFKNGHQGLDVEFYLALDAMRAGKLEKCGIWLYQVARILAKKNGKEVSHLPPYESIYTKVPLGNDGPSEQEAMQFVEEHFK